MIRTIPPQVLWDTGLKDTASPQSPRSSREPLALYIQCSQHSGAGKDARARRPSSIMMAVACRYFGV